MHCIVPQYALHLLLLGLLIGTTVTNAQNCTANSCLVHVYYVSPEGKTWFVDKTCPPNIYSGRNQTTVGANVSLDSIYYFLCLTCYGVSGDFAKCQCYLCRLTESCFLTGVCSVLTDTSATVTPITIIGQTLVVLPTTTSTAPVSVYKTSEKTTNNQPATSTETTANITSSHVPLPTERQPGSAAIGVAVGATLSIVMIAILACIGVTICVVVIITIQKRRKRKDCHTLRETVYAEVDNTALYTELAAINSQNSLSFLLGAELSPGASQDEENNATYNNIEDGIQEFTLNNTRNVPEEMYGLITRKEELDERETADPWYYNNSQLLKLKSSVNNTGKLTFLPVPSYTERNSFHVESPGFETYAKCMSDLSTGKIEHSY